MIWVVYWFTLLILWQSVTTNWKANWRLVWQVVRPVCLPSFLKDALFSSSPWMSSRNQFLQVHHFDRLSIQVFSQIFGAGWQCGYPSFCPIFVLCLAFVQPTSSICLNFVPVKHLSNICPRNLTFAPGKSNLCPYSPTYVLFLSSVLAKIHQKLKDKSWSYVGLENCLIWHLVTLHLDKKWTISGHEENQHLSTFCPKTKILP